jgi:DnaA family protein
MSGRSAQLVLPISVNPGATWRHWVSREETGEVESFARTLLDQGGVGLFLWASEGQGKSHFLQACSAAKPGARYLPMESLLDYPPEAVLEHAENENMVVVDDIHLIDGHRSWQEALFHCFNRCAETGTPFLASATQSPAGLKNVLADLQSRLSLLTTFKLPAWELDDFERLLGHLAHDRGLLLSDDVARYLTMRIQRRPLDAVNVIATIDESTLVEKRSPTIPFLKLLGL